MFSSMMQLLQLHCIRPVDWWWRWRTDRPKVMETEKLLCACLLYTVHTVLLVGTWFTTQFNINVFVGFCCFVWVWLMKLLALHTDKYNRTYRFFFSELLCDESLSWVELMYGRCAVVKLLQESMFIRVPWTKNNILRFFLRCFCTDFFLLYFILPNSLTYFSSALHLCFIFVAYISGVLFLLWQLL